MGQPCIASIAGKVDLGAFVARGSTSQWSTLAKALGDFFQAFEVVAASAQGPTGMEGRQQVLQMQVFQNAGNPGAQIVVEQDGARVEVLDHHAPLHPHHRLQREGFTVGQSQGLRFFRSGLMEPRRTFRPAMWKIWRNCDRLAR